MSDQYKGRVEKDAWGREHVTVKKTSWDAELAEGIVTGVLVGGFKLTRGAFGLIGTMRKNAKEQQAVNALTMAEDMVMKGYHQEAVWSYPGQVDNRLLGDGSNGCPSPFVFGG